MRQHQHLDVVNSAHRNAEKIAHTDVDRHPHAVGERSSTTRSR